MTEAVIEQQGELGLGDTPRARPVVATSSRLKRILRSTLLRDGVAVAGVLSVVVWGAWVTHELTGVRQDRIVSVKLSALVGSYVEAQRYSGSPPERVKAEMTAFMVSLDKELQRRGAEGEVVLVGEAVLTKNVSDVTASVRKAVFASGVPVPRRLTPEQIAEMAVASAPRRELPPEPELPGAPAPLPAPAPFIGPAPAGGNMAGDPFAPQYRPQMGDPSAVPMGSPVGGGASVSSFGGPGGGGN
ncbi:hypothetical protein FHS96_005306 [Sphingomonas zeicaulis]|uniref:TrbI F-type domain-containing protein n=1 Tax=Sphingomonas zeicaulis TaxID=1632740 RepID=UPI003D25DB44